MYMLKQISKRSALQLYLDGSKNISILKTSEKGNHILYDLDKLLKDAKFLIDDGYDVEQDMSIEEQQIVSSQEDIKAEQPDIESEQIEESAEDTEEFVEQPDNNGEIKIQLKGGKTLDIGKMLALLDANWSIADVARELHVSIPTISKYKRLYQK